MGKREDKDHGLDTSGQTVIQVSNMLRTLLIIVVITFTNSLLFAHPCSYWIAMIDPNVEKVGFDLDESDPANVMKGIACLLKQQGRKEPGTLYGGKDYVSQLVPRASVEVNALYRISVLFSGNDNFAQAVALVKSGDDQVFNSDRVVKKAFRSYRKWFRKVRKIGLEAARTQRLDPLANSGVEWY